MNRKAFQNSPVKQMMAANNPSLWNINNLMRPPFMPSPPPPPSSTTHFFAPLSNHNSNHDNNLFQAQYNMNMPITTSSSSWLQDPHPSYHHEQQHQIPESLSHLLLGGIFLGEESKNMEGWEEQVVLQHQQHPSVVDAKKESSVNSISRTNNNPNNNSNVFIDHDKEFHQLGAAKAATNWSSQISIPASSPQSCVTSFSSNNTNSMLDFTSNSSDTNDLQSRHPIPAPDHYSEVRKEKLGDRVTALHQLVSPFGKTDTASVLLEAIGYIRFLHSQIEALSLPYMRSGAGNKRQLHPHSCKDPKDLRSRELCLVPVSSTLHVGSDNGSDYWAPVFGGGFR